MTKLPLNEQANAVRNIKFSEDRKEDIAIKQEMISVLKEKTNYKKDEETSKEKRERRSKIRNLAWDDAEKIQKLKDVLYTEEELKQKENFNETIYQDRASHRHDKISNEDFELLKPLTTRYSYSMKWEVKIHRFDDKSFYIPDYDKVDLRYSDMDYQENWKKDNSKRVFENLKNSPKMQELAKKNGLDLSTISFKESLNTFLHLWQSIADAYGMWITFDIEFIENNEKSVKRILKWIYSITGQTVIMPYKIDDKGYVSSCDVYSDDSWVYYYYYNLSSFIACRS